MRYFQNIGEIDVAPLRAQLEAHPELWDENPLRRTYPNSPHREMVDIWVRARAQTGDVLASYSEPHESVWWPATEHIPAIVTMTQDLIARLAVDRLGGILVTKVPAGKRIYPHCDRGFWHAEFHNRKVYVCVQGNDQCVTWCEDERVTMKTGEVWLFNNLVTHGLDNDGATDRISAIFAMRTGDGQA